ncbi:hypothetical protein [Paenibacillus taihuensis]|nr:hypothetical protein [Paenibacillus taihuensis]
MELDRADDEVYYSAIESFINGSLDVGYSYIYPRDEEDLLHQVDHFTPKNDKGHKPIYIFVWSKLSLHWDVASITDIVKVLASEFLHMSVEEVQLIRIATYEETKLAYERDYKPYAPQ